MQRLSLVFAVVLGACAKEPVDYQCFYDQEEVDEAPPDSTDEYVVCMPRKLVGCSVCDGDYCYDRLRDANPDDENLQTFERSEVAICGPEPVGDDDRCCYQVSFYDAG